MKKIISILIGILIINVIPVNATENLQPTLDNIKTYIGTSILSGAGVNLTTSSMKTDSGNKLFDKLVEVNQIEFKHNDTYKKLPQFINEDGSIPSDWCGSFKLVGNALSTTMDFIGTIPSSEVNTQSELVFSQLVSNEMGASDIITLASSHPSIRMHYKINNIQYYQDFSSYVSSVRDFTIGFNRVSSNTGYLGINRATYENFVIRSSDREKIYLDLLMPQVGNMFTVTINGITDFNNNPYASSLTTTIPYDPSITQGADRDKLTTNIPVDTDLKVGSNINYVISDKSVTWQEILDGGFIVNKPTQSNTINISANIEPYLEVRTSTNQIDLDLTPVSDSSSEILTNVSSNLNFNMSVEFSGLKNDSNNELISDELIHLSLEDRVINLVNNETTQIFDNYSLGVKDYPFMFNIESTRIIKSGLYNGKLTFKVSQL